MMKKISNYTIRIYTTLKKIISENKITIELTNSEGIILSELIAKLTKEESQIEIIDESEEKLLWGLECILEKNLKMAIFILHIHHQYLNK